MDITRMVDNVFLTKLFPDGLTDPVCLGQILFGLQGRFYLNLNIHIKQKPSIEVDKWGEWGKDYNVIVIRLNGTCKDSAIKNWGNADYAPISIDTRGDTLVISQTGFDWSIELICCCSGFILDGFEAYYDDEAE